MQITTAKNNNGFTLVEIMIVVAIIGLLAAIAVPNFVRARETAQKNAIINNLRVIESAKQQWALEKKKASADTPVATDLTPYLKGNNMPTAVAGETYNINAVNTEATATLAAAIDGFTQLQITY
nr:prepilin-type N-terminal cleavage/methylation domain-containing protein [Cytophagales bacterium]